MFSPSPPSSPYFLREFCHHGFPFNQVAAYDQGEQQGIHIRKDPHQQGSHAVPLLYHHIVSPFIPHTDDFDESLSMMIVGYRLWSWTHFLVDKVKFLGFLGACVFFAHRQQALRPEMRQHLERFLMYDFSYQEFASSQPQPEGEDVMEAGVRVVLIAASETPPPPASMSSGTKLPRRSKTAWISRVVATKRLEGGCDEGGRKNQPPILLLLLPIFPVPISPILSPRLSLSVPEYMSPLLYCCPQL